jgi:GDP-4-dehydro-6-deoxy-D-mannose reductase
VRLLITGAGGFAGSHLTELCAACGDEVWGTVWPVRAQADITPRYGERELIPLNIAEAAGVAETVRRARPEGVIHLAGMAFVPQATRDPRGAYAANFSGTVNLLDALARHAPDARAVMVTSADAYGPVPEARQPITEDEPLRPVTVYGVSKAAADAAALQAARGNRQPVIVARPFNHIGTRQHPSFVAANFARQIAQAEAGQQEPLLRVGDLSAVRDFTDVRDMVAGYRLLLDRGVPGEAYNLASGTGRSIRDLLDGLCALARVPVRTETDTARLRASDTPRVVGDSAKARALGWQPRCAWTDTLQTLLDYWRTQCAHS